MVVDKFGNSIKNTSLDGIWTGSEVRTDVRLSDVDELDMLQQPREAGQNVKSSANASRPRSAPPRGTQFPMSALMYRRG